MGHQILGLADWRPGLQVGWVRDQQITNALERPSHHRGRQRIGTADADRQVQPFGGQVEHLIAHGQLDLHFGKKRAETGQQRGQPPIAKDQRSTHAQHALRLLAVRSGTRHRKLGALQHQHTIGVHGRTYLRQRQGPGRAVEQLHPQLGLQAAYATAHGTGGEAQVACCTRKTMLGHHLDKYLHVGERKRVGIHGHRSLHQRQQLIDFKPYCQFYRKA